VSDPVEFLRSLGSTSTEVAESLRAMGVKAERETCYRCPIAVVLVDELGMDVDDIEVDGKTASFQDAERPSLHLPGAVRKFIDEFDNGSYPFLEGDHLEWLRKQRAARRSLAGQMTIGGSA
jgi:hypothetical protein